MIGSRWRGLRWAAIVAAIGTGLGCGGRSLPPGTAGRIAPAAAPDDRDLMPDILRRYTSCKTYRDRGTVVATHFTPKGSYVEIHRFETLFVRGHGLRFRFTEETGELEAAIWARGDRVRRWASGDEVPSPSLEAAAGTAGHSTELVTWIVPRLLLGVRPTNEPTHIVGWDSGGSAEMGFALLHPRRFAALSIDAKKGIVWRFTVRAPVSESPEYDAKTRAVLPTVLVTYEPSFDVDEATALRELDVPPWPASRTPSEGERE